MKSLRRFIWLSFAVGLVLFKGNEVLAAESNYLWPVPDSTNITQYYTLGINGGEHDGLDITASWDVPIVASKSGTVVKVLYNQDETNWVGYGYGVVISHGDGYYTHYAHMSSVSVSVNQIVSQGQQIGNMGNTGNSTGRHLHFAIATSIYGGGYRINNNPGTISYIYNTTPDITKVTPTVSVSLAGVMTSNFSAVSNVHHYDVVLYGTNYKELNYVNVGTQTSGSLQLPRYGVYYVGINAYGADGSKTSSIMKRFVWSGTRINIGTNLITMIKSKKGHYLYADTINNVVKTTTEIDYESLDNYFFRIVRLNDDNDFAIYSMANGKVFTISGSSIANESGIELSTYSGKGSQTFGIKYNYDGDAYVIFPVTYSFILDSGHSSGNLYIYDYTHYANDNQYFNLLKLNMNPVAIGFEGEYDGKEHVISVSDIPDGATIEYKLGLDGTWSTSHPICQETGSYDVYYKIEHDYYTTYTGSVNITITEKEDDSEQNSNVNDEKDDSEQDSNVNDEKNDSEQNNSVDDEKNDVQQEDINDNTENLDDDGDDDSEECIEVGSRVELSTGSYVVMSVSGNAREVTYLSPKNTKKTSITIPATVDINGYTYKVTEIAPKAFKNNKKLKSVTIGKNVKKIGKEAFYNCKKLKKITIKSNVLKSVGKNAIKGINKKATIKVPKKQLKKYKKLFKSKTGYKQSMKIKK